MCISVRVRCQVRLRRLNKSIRVALGRSLLFVFPNEALEMSDPNIAINPPCKPLENAPPVNVGCIGSPVPQTLIGRLSMQTDDAQQLQERVVARYVADRWQTDGDYQCCSPGIYHGLLCGSNGWLGITVASFTSETTTVSQQADPFEVVIDHAYTGGNVDDCVGTWRITWTEF